MIGRKIVAGLAAVALAATPVVASAAQPLSLAAAPQARAGAPMDDANGLRGDRTLLYVGVVAAVLLILWLTDTWPFDDDDPDSP